MRMLVSGFVKVEWFYDCNKGFIDTIYTCLSLFKFDLNRSKHFKSTVQPRKQYVIIKISAVFHCLSVGYFRSSKRWNIYYKTVFFCVHFIYFSFRSSHKRFSVKKGVLKSFENSAILQLLEACNFIKKRLWHRCFPVNFAIFLRTCFLQKTSRRLLLASIQARVFQHRSKQHKS